MAQRLSWMDKYEQELVPAIFLEIKVAHGNSTCACTTSQFDRRKRTIDNV